MNRYPIRRLALAVAALVALVLGSAARAQTVPSPPVSSTSVESPTSATQPTTLPAVPADPTIPNEQLRIYLQQMAQKDHGTSPTATKPLDITLQALVVNNHGDATAILTVSGHGNFMVSAGSVIALTGDASGPQVKVIGISASGVQVLLPQAKSSVTIK